jgi:hypothetical protein
LGRSQWTGPRLSPPSSEFNATGPRVVRDLLRRLDRVREDGRNGLLLFEGLSVADSGWIAELAAHLRATRWSSVVVVVAYRPLYSWLPSKYNSVTKVGKNPSVVRWPDDPACLADGSGCHHVEPFSLDLPTGRNPRDDRFDEYVRYLESSRMHPSHVTYLNYAAHFDDVRVLPLHLLASSPSSSSAMVGDPLLEHLFCVSLPDAPEACRAVRTGRASAGARNSLDPSPDYDRLAVHARQTHAHDRARWNASRPELRDWTRSFHERALGGGPLPRLCWNGTELGRLEELSWAVERRMFRDLSGRPGVPPPDEALHRRGFSRAARDRRSSYYCSLDVKRTLDGDPRWRAFYDAPYDPETAA